MEVGFGFSGAFLLSIFIFLFGFGCVVYLRSKKRSFLAGNASKEHVLKGVCMLSGVRVIQYCVLILLSFDIMDGEVLYLLLVLGVDLGGIFFFLLYLNLLLYWASFLGVIETGTSPAQYLQHHTNVILWRLEVVALGLCCADILISFALFLFEAHQSLFKFHLYAHCVFTLLLVLEGLSFLIISGLVSRSLWKMGKYTILAHKAAQVLITGIVVMCLFLYCAILSIFALIRAFEMLKSYDDDTDTDTPDEFLSDFVDAMYGYWAMYLMYIIVGEVVPLSFLVFFQARAQRREKPANYMDLNLGEGESTEISSVLSSTYNNVLYESVDSP